MILDLNDRITLLLELLYLIVADLPLGMKRLPPFPFGLAALIFARRFRDDLWCRGHFHRRLLLLRRKFLYRLSNSLLMPLNEPLKSLIRVLEKMPAIGNLLRLRRAFACSISVGACAIASDDLNFRMALQPLFQWRGLSPLQQIDRPALLQIHKNRAVILSFLERPIIHSESSHFYFIWRSRRRLPHAPQDGIHSGLHPEFRCRLGSWSSTEREAD